MKRVSKGMKLPPVKEAMRKSVSILGVDSTIEDAAKLMVEEDTRTIIVNNKIGNPMGLVTGGDVVKAVAKKLSPKTKISELVSKELISVDSEMDIIEAAGVMNEKGIKRLAVTEGGKLSGVLSTKDVLRYSPQYIIEFSRTLDKLDGIIKKL